MAEETIRTRQEDLRDRKGNLRKHRERLEDEIKRLGAQIEKAEKRAKKLKTEAAREKAADHADFLRGERRRKQADLEDVKAELGDVNARLRQLARKAKKQAQKLAARRKYWASEHFRFDEFDCNDGTPVPLAAYEALRAWCRDIGEPVRARFGSVHVNSGYRHRAYNARIGGEPNSVHIYDAHPDAVAVDFTCAKGTPAEWYEFTAGKADGRGRYASFHHADNRNRIGWPDATWSG